MANWIIRSSNVKDVGILLTGKEHCTVPGGLSLMENPNLFPVEIRFGFYFVLKQKALSKIEFF